MVGTIIKRISKGSRFNQIYMKKNEGIGFEPGKSVIIKPLEVILDKPTLLEYNIKLLPLKKEIIKQIFSIIIEHASFGNILITGSFLQKGYRFEDIDIVILDPEVVDKQVIKKRIRNILGIEPHLILISYHDFQKGVSRDPLFHLMIDHYVAYKRIIFKKKKSINFQFLDAHLVRNNNLLIAFESYTLQERKKVLRDIISIKLFSEGKALSHKAIRMETEKIFGKKLLEDLFTFAHTDAEPVFLKKLKVLLKKMEEFLIENASKQIRYNKEIHRDSK